MNETKAGKVPELDRCPLNISGVTGVTVRMAGETVGGVF